MELAIATSFDHNKLHQKFDNHPRVLPPKLAYNLAKALKHYLKENGEKYIANTTLLVICMI
jgi:hypothetical protein